MRPHYLTLARFSTCPSDVLTEGVPALLNPPAGQQALCAVAAWHEDDKEHYALVVPWEDDPLVVSGSDAFLFLGIFHEGAPAAARAGLAEVRPLLRPNKTVAWPMLYEGGDPPPHRTYPLALEELPVLALSIAGLPCVVRSTLLESRMCFLDPHAEDVAILTTDDDPETFIQEVNPELLDTWRDWNGQLLEILNGPTEWAYLGLPGRLCEEHRA